MERVSTSSELWLRTALSIGGSSSGFASAVQGLGSGGSTIGGSSQNCGAERGRGSPLPISSTTILKMDYLSRLPVLAAAAVKIVLHQPMAVLVPHHFTYGSCSGNWSDLVIDPKRDMRLPLERVSSVLLIRAQGLIFCGTRGRRWLYI